MWTPSALASEFRPYKGRVWRVVEAQHRISTNRLSASLDEQRLLEELAEAVKPDLPSSARGLHYLLASPFRYGHRSSSRFRRADERPGIFYASEAEAAAIAETAYWRLVFLSRSPGLAPPTTTSEHSSFSVAVGIERNIDLTDQPFARDASRWTSNDYSDCQSLGTAARTAGCQGIRYTSARDPEHRANLALFDPAAFVDKAPRTGTTWHLRFDARNMIALAAFPSSRQLRFSDADLGLA
jgi:hypothetical protein